MYKKIAIFTLTIIALTGITACHSLKEKSQVHTNTELATDALTIMFDKLDTSVIDRYYSDNYIQHTPSIKDGKAGIIEAVAGMKAAKVSIDREIIRTLSEGDLVYVQSRVSFGGSPENVVVDIFRIEDNKIIEHWDVMQDEVLKADSANGNGMLDGGGDANKSLSTQDLEENKQTIIAFIEKGFAGDAELLDSLFGDEYIQHNPHVPSGKAVVLGFLKDGGFPADIKRIIAQGDLVAVFVEYGQAGTAFHNACADLFRFDDASKVVEHWDTCSSVPKPSEFMHNNGIF